MGITLKLSVFGAFSVFHLQSFSSSTHTHTLTYSVNYFSTDQLSREDLRLQKLKEWKKKRDEAREKEKQLKKKPFFGGGARHVSTKPLQPPVPKSKTSRKEKPAATCDKTALKQIPSTSKSASTVTSMTSAATAKKKGAGDSNTLQNTHRNLSQKVMMEASKLERKATATKTTRASKCTTKQLQRKEPSAKPPSRVTSVISEARKKPASSSEQGKPNTSSTRVTRSNSSRNVQCSGTTASGASTSDKKRVKQTMPVKTKLAYSESSSDSADTDSLLPAPCSSPPLSPSLSSNTVPDCAWIPNQHVFPRQMPCKSVEDLLGPCTFSPFKFTASASRSGCGLAKSAKRSGSKRKATPGKPFVFNFRKTVDLVPLSLPSETMYSDATADTISVDSLDCNTSIAIPAQDSYVPMQSARVPKATDGVASDVNEEPILRVVAMATQRAPEAMETDPIAVSSGSEEVEVVPEEKCTLPGFNKGISLENVGVAAWCGRVGEGVGISGEGGSNGQPDLEESEDGQQ